MLFINLLLILLMYVQVAYIIISYIGKLANLKKDVILIKSRMMLLVLVQ